MTAINAQYFTNLIAAINAADSCAGLQALVTEAFTAIAEQQTSALSQLSIFEALQSLTTMSLSDLANVTSFCSALQSYLATQLAPYATLVEQMTAMAAQVTELAEAVNNAAARFENCSITIPSIPT